MEGLDASGFGISDQPSAMVRAALVSLLNQRCCTWTGLCIGLDRGAGLAASDLTSISTSSSTVDGLSGSCSPAFPPRAVRSNDLVRVVSYPRFNGSDDCVLIGHAVSSDAIFIRFSAQNVFFGLLATCDQTTLRNDGFRTRFSSLAAREALSRPPKRLYRLE